jgi:hypothetical protein
MKFINPYYSLPDGGKGIAPAVIFFGSEDRTEKHLLPYEWQETRDGIKATVTKPLFAKYSNPCDLLLDVTLALQEDLGRKIDSIEWTW